MTRCPKWRQGTPKAKVRKSLLGVTKLVEEPRSMQARMIADTDSSLHKTRYMLACGLAHCSVHLGVHPTAKLNFNDDYPGDSYKVPYVTRRILYDNCECVYNAIGLRAYGEDAQPQVRKNCNDWLENNVMIGAPGGLKITSEEVSVPISFLQELQSPREIWDLRFDDEIMEYIYTMRKSAPEAGERVWGSDLECLIAAYDYGRVVECWYPNLDTGAIRCCEYRPPDSLLREDSDPIILLHE